MSLAGVPTQLLSMGCECSFLLLLLAWNVRPHKTGRHRWICGSEKSDWRANRRPSVGHKRSSPRQIGRFTNSRADPKILQQLPVTLKPLFVCGQRNMGKAGIDQSIRMKISGHKTDSMERRYNIVDIEDVKSAAKQMAKWIKGEKAKKEKGKT